MSTFGLIALIVVGAFAVGCILVLVILSFGDDEVWR